MKYSSIFAAIWQFNAFSISLAALPQIPIQDQIKSRHRVAIIGAGAGGSSAAYHLQKFYSERALSGSLNITIYEADSRIGGRTTTVNALDDPRFPAELGASIFVKINHILYNLTRDFGLSSQVKVFETTNSKYDFGVWNGNDFVYKQADDGGSNWRGYWDIVKLIWKYGMSPIRTRNAMKDAVGRFLKFYEEPIFPFASLQHAVEEVQLLQYTGMSGEEVLRAAGVSEQFAQELVQASTRVNYAQNLAWIHGLEALVCVAAEGAMAIEGGNWQIFEHAVKFSGADVHLASPVSEIETTDKGTYLIYTSNDSTVTSPPSEYDTVILAAPHQFANITFTTPLPHTPPEIPYVSLYVTLFTTPHLISPQFFNQTTQADVPSSVLTTLPPNYNLSSPFAFSSNSENPPPWEDNPGEPSYFSSPHKIWSLSTLRTIPPTAKNPREQYLYKIFSPAPLTATYLASLFDIPYEMPSTSVELITDDQDGSTTMTNPTGQQRAEDDPISNIPRDYLIWFHEKRWDSYPHEIPRTEFGSFVLDEAEEIVDGRKSSGGGGGIYYTSVIEPFISTMETSALAGMNVARLIVDKLALGQSTLQ